VTILVGYLIASWVVRVLLRWLVRRTPTQFDDLFLEKIDGPVRYFVLVFFIQVSTLRLTFWDENALRFLGNLFFLLYLAILFWAAWRLVGFSLEWYRQQMAPRTEEQVDRIDKTLPLIGRILYVFLIFTAVIIALSHFNVNVTALLAAIGILGFAFSLAAQDALNDIISGVLIWMDRPFRIGDRIEVQGENTWGDVIDIGTRTTRILSRSNTMVIVPNSVIGKNQVVNFTYPDSTFRIEVEFMLDYEEDLDKVRRIVVEAVRQVEHVLSDKPVDALFRDFGESTIIFRVRWWIDSFVDTYLMYDKVNNAILEALRAADIAIAVPKQDFSVRIRDGENI
jgi:small-conductance mechanosensitive channel